MASSQIETITSVLAALAADAPRGIRDDLDDCLEKVQARINRTRERNKDSVLHALRLNNYRVEDIAQATELSFGYTCSLLRELVRERQIIARKVRTGNKGRPCKHYFLREITPGKNKPAA